MPKLNSIVYNIYYIGVVVMLKFRRFDDYVFDCFLRSIPDPVDALQIVVPDVRMSVMGQVSD